MEIVCKYFLLFLFYSFLGWVLEMVVCSIADKKVVNRGFLIGPYCPIYGSGCLLIIFLLNKYQDDPFTLFIMAIIVCSLLEYFTSYIMEKLFKARWWDYSDRMFNINGRICLDNLVLFGVLGLLIFYVANPFFEGLVDKFNYTVLIVVSIVLFIIFMIDGIISLKVISGFKNVAKSIHKDSTDEITSKVRELLLKKNWLYKRLIKAFDFKASERLLRELHNKAKKTIEKGVEATQKTIHAGAEVAHKTIKTGVEVTQKKIKETKKIVKEKVSDFNDKKRK
ncbi:MAG: hypothetical protein ACI4WW_01410 [Candidatus Coprovivens sp.]